MYVHMYVYVCMCMYVCIYMYIDIVNGRIGGYLPYTSVQPSEEQRQDYMNDRRLNHLCPQTYNRGFMYFSCIIINYKSINIYTPL